MYGLLVADMNDEIPGTQLDIDDDLFSDVADRNTLVIRQELLEVGHVPNQDRIIGREVEMQSVAEYVKPVLLNNPPGSFIIYGKTGTGKSLVSRSVASRAKRTAANNGIDVGVVYVDCSQKSTETQVTSALARRLNDPDVTEYTVPRHGLSSDHYYDYLWDTINALYDSAIIILDEIDQLVSAGQNESGVLMQLTRAKENAKIDADIGIMAISNKINYRDSLNERVKSSLGDDEIVFSPYDSNQIRSILEARTDAFKEGVLDDAVIPKTAALAGREHGDARRAIRILRNAAKIAENENADRIVEDHVERAQTHAEADRLRELLSGLPTHARYIIVALANLDKKDKSRDEFRTSAIQEVYNTICEQEGSTPLGLHRIRQLLKEMAFLEIIESDKTGGGRGRGQYTVHRLMYSQEAIIEMAGGDVDHF